jgi:hypothetical protein
MPNGTSKIQEGSVYPNKIIVDVEAKLHLQHTDIKKHSIEEVRGKIISYPNKGNYDITLNPGRPFIQITSGPCIVLIILFILDWPQPTGRKLKGMPQPVNFLDLSDGEYSATVRLSFDDGYAFKHVEMKKLGRSHYKATIESFHRYPSSKSKDLVRILPHDVTIVDGGHGRLLGRTEVRWLSANGSIMSGDATIEVNLVNKHARLYFPELFSYEYYHSDFSELPMRIKARGLMRVVGIPFDAFSQKEP